MFSYSFSALCGRQNTRGAPNELPALIFVNCGEQSHCRRWAHLRLCPARVACLREIRAWVPLATPLTAYVTDPSADAFNARDRVHLRPATGLPLLADANVRTTANRPAGVS